MSVDVVEKNYDLRTTPKKIFESLYDSRKAREWFPSIHVTHAEDTTNKAQLRKDGIEYVAQINEAIPHSLIKGTIISLNDDEMQDFEWRIVPNNEIKKWTRLTTKTTIKQKQKQRNWISPLPAVGAGIGILAMLEGGFANMSSAFATTTSSSVLVSSSTIASVNTSASTISVPVQTAIIISSIVIATGGLVFTDAFYSDPVVEYSTYPAQLPAEYYGTAIVIQDVFSTDTKSKIINYDCNVQPIVYGTDYTFDCIVENSLGNTETIQTTIILKPPINRLGPVATSCVDDNLVLPNDVTEKFPYLLNLPNFSPNKITVLKNDHIKMMDNSYDLRDYESAKQHATIILKYFNINEHQVLSTLGNLLRDQDRTNLLGIKCAMAIHETPFLLSTTWGKLSLSEDLHVLGKYDESIKLSSKVIENYEHDKNDVSSESYVNALIIKANALYRMALETDKDFDDAKIFYSKAHQIEESYATWFGLGNVDRQETNFDAAFEKYQHAKALVIDTTEIDNAISNMGYGSRL